MQPVTIIRVQTPVCAVPGVLLPVRGHCAVRGVRDAHVSRPCTATPVLSCHDVLAVAADLFTPPCSEPRRATSPRKKKKTDAPRTAPHAAPTPPFVLPPLFCPLWPALSFCNEAREAGDSRLVFPHAYLHNKQSVLGLSRLFAGPCSVSAAGTAIVAVAGSPFLLHHTDSSGAGCCVDRACLCLLSVWSCLSAGRLSPQHTPAPPLLALLTVHSRLFLVLARQLL